MIVTASRGQALVEPFNFKNDRGQPLNIPVGTFSLTLERGDFVRHWDHMPTSQNSILWKMTAEETNALQYDTLYFVLFFNGQEVTRGVLRVN